MQSVHIDGQETTAPSEDAILRGIRRALLFILWIGVVGMLVELLLLRHVEDATQLIPVALLGVAIAVLAWFAIAPGARALRVLQLLMVLLVLAGAIGTILHFRANVGYDRESNPSLEGRELYWNAISGSTPTLAAGALVHLGLVGLAFTFRHPRLRRRGQSSDIGNDSS